MIETTAAKHTPGPWHTGAGNGEGSIFCKEGRLRLTDRGTTLYSICHVTHGYDQAEDDANASLIAAAPELLEACRAALPRLMVLADSKLFGEAADIAACILLRSVIAKAEGR